MNCGKIIDQAISSDSSLEKIPEKTIHLFNEWLDEEINKNKNYR